MDAISSNVINDAFDWAGSKAWLVGKGFTAKYVSDVMCYARRFASAFFRGNLSGMDEHGLKGLACLSKYLGCYERFIAMKRQSGLKWYSKNSEDVFMEMFEGKEVADDTEKWMDCLKGKLQGVREDIWTAVVFLALSGVRPIEGILCLNKISQNGLVAYPLNSQMQALEHFRDKRFLRRTKKCYLTPLTDEMMERLGNWRSYMTYKKIKVWVKKVGVWDGLYKLRKWHATVLRTNRIPSEFVDLLEGRVGRTVFAKSYFRPDLVAMLGQVREIIEPYEKRWLD